MDKVLVFVVILLASPVFAVDSADIAVCIRAPSCTRVMIVSHRGKGFGHHENSRGAARAVVAAGIPVMELDISLSKDGVMFVLHDKTLNRTTRSSGKIANKTARKLSAVYLRNGELLPRFADIYDITRGKLVLNLDFKSSAQPQMAKWIDVNGSFDDVLFFADNEDKLATAVQLKRIYPEMMVVGRLNESFSLSAMTLALATPPEIVYVDNPTRHQVENIVAGGSKVFSSITVADLGWRYIFKGKRAKRARSLKYMGGTVY